MLEELLGCVHFERVASSELWGLRQPKVGGFAIIVFGSLQKSLKGVRFRECNWRWWASEGCRIGKGRDGRRALSNVSRCKSYGSVRVHRARGCNKAWESSLGCPGHSSPAAWWAHGGLRQSRFCKPPVSQVSRDNSTKFFFSRGSWQLESSFWLDFSTLRCSHGRAMQMNH